MDDRVENLVFPNWRELSESDLEINLTDSQCEVYDMIFTFIRDMPNWMDRWPSHSKLDEMTRLWIRFTRVGSIADGELTFFSIITSM